MNFIRVQVTDKSGVWYSSSCCRGMTPEAHVTYLNARAADMLSAARFTLATEEAYQEYWAVRRLTTEFKLRMSRTKLYVEPK